MGRGLVGLKVKDLFFDSKKVKAALRKADRRNLSKFGAMVRREARQTMRPARKASLHSIPPEQRKYYVPRTGRDGRILPRHLQPKPVREMRRPLKASKPGQPPRVRKGQIKKLTFFSFDPTANSVVVGPAKLPGFSDPNVLKTLEEGGRNRYGPVAKRPHTLPASRRKLPKLSALWRDSVRG